VVVADSLQFTGLLALSMVEVPTELEIHPESGRHSKELPKSQRCTGGNAPTTVYQFVDALIGNMNTLGKFLLGNSEGLQEL